MNSQVKILVCYHKPEKIYGCSFFFPIQVGRAVASLKSKDGIMTEEEESWLIKNLIGDDTGENISRENRYFCEMTGVYWAWKNLNKLEYPEFIGLSHYRRLFSFNSINSKTSTARYFPDFIPLSKQNKIFNEEYLLAILTGKDVVAPRPIPLNCTVKENFFLHHNPLDIRDISEILKTKSPEFYNYFQKYLLETKGYFGNLFILRRTEFENYCSLIFESLLAFQKNLKNEPHFREKERVAGYISELLTGAFLYMMKSKAPEKYFELPVIYTQKPTVYPVSVFNKRYLLSFPDNIYEIDCFCRKMVFGVIGVFNCNKSKSLKLSLERQKII